MIYIAGPMSGIPDYNYPKFDAAQAYLEACDFEVLNPANNFGRNQSLEWDVYLKLAVKQVVDCDLVLLLPGWETSKGARLEKHIANQLGISVSTFEDFVNSSRGGPL